MSTVHSEQKSLVFSHIIAFALTFAILGANGCFAEDNKKTNELVVRMGSFSKAVSYAPYLVARRKHLFEQALKPVNGKVSHEVFQSLPSLNEAIAVTNHDIRPTVNHYQLPSHSLTSRS